MGRERFLHLFAPIPKQKQRLSPPNAKRNERSNLRVETTTWLALRFPSRSAILEAAFPPCRHWVALHRVELFVE